MKKTVAIMLILALGLSPASVLAEDITLRPEVVVPELVGLPLSTEGARELQADLKGPELVRLTQYSDLGGSSQAKDAVRMTFEGAFKSSGSGRFNPKSTITRQDALTLLVRMLGQEAAVQAAVLGASQGQGADSVASQLRQAYADQAATLGIRTADESGSLDQAATRQEIAVWTARAIGLQPDYADVDGIWTYKDSQAVRPENRGLLEALLKEKIMTADAGGLFNPARTVTREEMAGLLAKISPRLYENRTLAVISGMVAGVTTQETTESGARITTRRVTVRGIDGAVTQVLAVNNSRTGTSSDFGVLKGGRVTGSAALAAGDQIELVTRNDLAVFAEVLSDGTILDKLKTDGMAGENLRTYFGTVHDRIAETRKEGDRTYSVERLRVKNHTGQTFDIVVRTDAATGVRSDIYVLKNGVSGGAALLQKGDFIEYTVKDPNLLVYAVAKPAQVSEVKGTVRAVAVPEGGPTTLTVQDYSNVIGTYPVAGYADISINTGYAKATDLKYAMPVTVTLNNGIITRIAAETFSNPGYIDPANRMVFGTVKSLMGNLLTLQKQDGTTGLYSLEGGSQLTKNGQPVSLGVLRAGDRVKLYFPDMTTLVPSKVEIEGPEQLIQGVYAGRLAQVNGATGLISLKDPTLLKNTQWTSSGAYMQDFYLPSDGAVYAQGKKITVNDLKNYYLNAEVYVARKNSYSRPEALRVVVKNGGERQFASGIYKVDQALNRLELQNRTNILLNSGTIVLRDDRLVDPGNITAQDTVSVISNYLAGLNQAAVVSLSGLQQLQLGGLTVGYVDVVYSGRVDLENHARLENNVMTQVDTGEPASLYFGTGTRITDVTDEDKPVTLTPYAFFHGGYDKEENEDTDNEGLDYERYYALAYSDQNGEVVDLMLRKSALFKNNDLDNTVERESRLDDEMNDQLADLVVTKGTVSGIDATWKRFRLSNGSDWIESLKEWNLNRSDINVAAQETLMVKNNRPITFDDIRIGDRIQVVRLRANSVLIVVEE